MQVSGRIPFSRIFCKNLEVEKTTKSGIIIEGTEKKSSVGDLAMYQDNPNKALVIAVGEGIKNSDRPICKPGDILLLRDGTYPLINDLGTVYMIVSEADIYLVREAEEENV